MVKLDILAFGAHPDDVELGCAGTIIKHQRLGKKVGIVDLTCGELGTRGTAELRATEAENAAKLMQIDARDNLEMPDGFFTNTQENLIKVIQKIRQYRPEIVLANATTDRHPDHGNGADLVSQACFLAGLAKIETTEQGEAQERWRPKAIYHYIQDWYHKPDVVVDISEAFSDKMDAIKCFSSQFYDPASKELNTPISGKGFLDFVIARAQQYGRLIGTEYGEGFTTPRPPGTANLFELL